MRDRTQEENDIVKKALDIRTCTLTMVTDGSDSVSHASMHRLCPGCWLNDEVVNFFLKICLNKQDVTLCDRHGGRKRSHAFCLFFMRNLFGEMLHDKEQHGTYKYENIARWSRKVPGGNILFPININDEHWTLAVVFMKERCIQYYDSLPDGNKVHTAIRNGVLQYLKDEYKAIHDGSELINCE